MERERLVSIHEKEYQDAQTNRSILHNAEQAEKAEQMELNLQMKQRNVEEKNEKEKTILEKVRDAVNQKLKTKNRQQEM